MNSTVRVHVPARQRVLFLTTLAVPLTGWTVHAVSLHRKLAAARRDPLTGLLTRDGYTTRAAALTTRFTQFAMVVLVDVDHFKEINDSFGHAAGDQVLIATAQRLTAWAGSRGVVGRLGGDEFAITVRSGAARRRLRLDQLTAVLAQPVHLGDGRLVNVSASIGAATPDRIGTSDLGLLQRAADAAMYDGKHGGLAILADRSHATVPSINGRRDRRPGTASLGVAACPPSPPCTPPTESAASPSSGPGLHTSSTATNGSRTGPAPGRRPGACCTPARRRTWTGPRSATRWWPAPSTATSDMPNAVLADARINGSHSSHTDDGGLCSPCSQPDCFPLSLDDVHELPIPVPRCGALGPWRVPLTVFEQVLHQLPHLNELFPEATS
ncbi:GGDEF domain-containing protein [Streptomyces sp. NPDC050523]|uniref:GGDEF domain-containing protein n=1 Tax=Streptomyces sp. NPDC050523 TaxID=3365622 RepID=UPI00378A40B0